MGNDAGISKFKYLSTIIDPGKYFTGHDVVYAIAIDFVSTSIDACVDLKQLRTSYGYIGHSSYITIINADDIKSEYLISFEADILNIDIIDIIAFRVENDNIRYHYKDGKEYDISDTIENEFLDEYRLMKEIVKTIRGLLKIIIAEAITLCMPDPDIIANKFASDFK